MRRLKKISHNFNNIKKSFCFVSETSRGERPILDPSVRYRCYHPAEILVEKGHFCSVYSALQFYENVCLDFDVYVFHRPNMARKNFDRVTDYLTKAGKILIADYDDLIFGDEHLALQSSAVKNSTLTEEKAVSSFESNLAALHKFAFVTVSTEPLARYAETFNKSAKVATVSNVLPPSIVKIHTELGTPFRNRPSHTIGYFAGTRSHDKDFPIVEEVIYRILLENPDFTFLIVGPVLVPRSIASLSNVSVAPVVNFLRLPSLMTMCSTVIAPLEVSEFNTCKSRVKFLEAALSGCRLIASAIPDMRALGSKRLFLAESKDDWYDALSSSPFGGRDAKMIKQNFDFLSDLINVEGLEVFGGLK